MKKLIFIFAALTAAFVSFADSPFVITSENGCSYISFTEDISKFGFTVTDRGVSESMIGTVYIDENGNKTDFGILKDFAEFKNVSKGGSIQFYLGDYSSDHMYSFMKNEDGTYKIAFKNINTSENSGNYNPGYYQGNHKGNGYGHNNGNGGGKWGNGANIYDSAFIDDAWLNIGNIKVIYADDQRAIHGMPLPSFWPTFLLFFILCSCFYVKFKI